MRQPGYSRLRPDLLDKQQVAASGCTVTTDDYSPVRGECAQGGAQLIIDAASIHLDCSKSAGTGESVVSPYDSHLVELLGSTHRKELLVYE